MRVEKPRGEVEEQVRDAASDGQSTRVAFPENLSPEFAGQALAEGARSESPGRVDKGGGAFDVGERTGWATTTRRDHVSEHAPVSSAGQEGCG